MINYYYNYYYYYYGYLTLQSIDDEILMPITCTSEDIVLYKNLR